jgi:cysteinyl-tRNA synthetase
MGRAGALDEDFMDRFAAQINDDLNMPRALAVVWDLVKSDLPPATKKATLLAFDAVLGLRLGEWEPPADVIPDAVLALVEQRQAARQARNWAEADTLRAQIAEAGYEVKDTPQGPTVTRRA